MAPARILVLPDLLGGGSESGHAVGAAFVSEGVAAGACELAVGERDSAGQLREGVDVLRGDPEMVAAVADTLEFEHKYTSGVIAWAPEDRPTDAQIEAVLDKFEQTAWAGLEPDRYAWTAVEHRERGGGVHVHVLAARCDLETGRSLNIAPPGWQQTFDPLRDGFNHEHGWSRPDDPARARTQQPGHRAYVVSALEEAGLDVPRQGDSYVTARDPDSGKRWRLKGALYEHDFEPKRLDREAAAEAGNRAAGDRGDGRARAAEAWQELERRCKRRAAFHRRRYGGVDRTDARSADARLAPAPGDGPEPLSRYLRRMLGDDALVVGKHREPDQDRGRAQREHQAGPRDPGADGAGLDADYKRRLGE